MTTFREYGTQAIEQRLEKMYSLVGDVRHAEDIEAIHDMRVATRRLRAAIEVFGPAFQSKQFTAFGKDVKRVTDALAEARDLDVMIEAVQSLAASLAKNERSGIDSFTENMIESRRKIQKEVLRALDAIELRDLRGAFAAIAEVATPSPTQRFDYEEESAGIVDPSATIEDHFSIGITGRMADLLALEPYIADPERVKELHAMRISAKKLRYTMELFAPFAVEGFDDAITKIKRIQEHLGEIHDADVLAPRLAQHLRQTLKGCGDESKGAHCTDFDAAAGLVKVCRRKRSERDSHYREFISEWRILRLEGFFDAVWAMAHGESPRLKSARKTREAVSAA
jgi:CHAD domain-containing protein